MQSSHVTAVIQARDDSIWDEGRDGGDTQNWIDLRRLAGVRNE